MKRILLPLLLLLATFGQAQTPEEVQRAYEARFAASPCPKPAEALRLAATDEERDALRFLYAYMDWADVTDYTPAFYVAQVRAALETRRDFYWGVNVPEREFRHFVLPIRVNNEHLDTFRTAYYTELRHRVAGMSMREAVLEINHWCHEHVTYRPSDARTSNPLATLRTATGRCGEESTLTVAALRTVGIPARQVYTPRWAHTDDNHAWVEAWVDGAWHFLGACEPAPELDIAWFNEPATRGMLMTTTVTGPYKGEEQVLKQYPLQTTINVTANYAPTSRVTVQVVDGTTGKPVSGARVRFGLYNYAELYPLYTALTDARGRASLESGRGDVVVWAAKDGRYGFRQYHAGRETGVVKVRLEHSPGETYTVNLDLTPPAPGAAAPVVSDVLARANDRRLAREDSIRAAYVRSWPDSSKICEVAEVLGLDAARLHPLFRKAEGNYMGVYDVLAAWDSDSIAVVGGEAKPLSEFAFDLLATLSDKDLRDMDATVVNDHLAAIFAAKSDGKVRNVAPHDWTDYKQYVLCPRIATEELTPWRTQLQPFLVGKDVEAWRRQPSRIADYIKKEVRLDTTETARVILQSPAGTLAYGVADARSQGLCFVALCRTLGVPARYDEVTGAYQYQDGGTWVVADFSAAPTPQREDSATLRLTYTPRPFHDNPSYYSHFTLSRLVGGLPQLQEYHETATWRDTFRDGTPVAAGDYLLMSGTRLASGGVLARMSVFPVRKDAEETLQLREDDGQVSVIGSFNAENTYYDVATQCRKSILSTTGRGYYAVSLLRAGDEPSTHVLHDLEAQRAALEAWGRPLLLVFASEADFAAFEARRGEFPNLPATVHFGIDTTGALAANLLPGLTTSAQRPATLIADTFNRVVFFSQGYTIGLGTQLVKVISKL